MLGQMDNQILPTGQSIHTFSPNQMGRTRTFNPIDLMLIDMRIDGSKEKVYAALMVSAMVVWFRIWNRKSGDLGAQGKCH